jgi:hypothetical protein
VCVPGVNWKDRGYRRRASHVDMVETVSLLQRFVPKVMNLAKAIETRRRFCLTKTVVLALKVSVTIGKTTKQKQRVKGILG